MNKKELFIYFSDYNTNDTIFVRPCVDIVARYWKACIQVVCTSQPTYTVEHPYASRGRPSWTAFWLKI
jgi:hypothetical protein